jgi:hypothetical protein
MGMTLNNIKALFQNIATSHYQIEGFGFGNLFEINELGQTTNLVPGIVYPCLWVVPVSSVTTEQTQQRTFNILVLGRLDKDKKNRDGLWSDCEQILNDVVKILRNESDDYEIIGEPELEPFDEQYSDWLVGWASRIVVQSQFDNNYCDVPSASINSPVAVPGYGIIKDQHGNVVTTLTRGQVYYIEILEEVQQTLGTVTPTIIQVIS